ncbi:MAG: response regulator transcription factor [Bacteroidales bacterium]|nr:response regulator transcription factor [Bacteroidales bacterium]
MEKNIHKTDLISSLNTVIGVTDEDYALVMPQLEDLLDNVSQISSSGYYVVDYFKHNFLYVSDSMEYWCGHTAEEIKMLGYDLYTQYVPQDELVILKIINEDIFRQFECIPDTERCKYTISYDFHFVIDGVKKIVKKHLTPYRLKNGKIWLALCRITLSDSKKVGNAILKKGKEQSYYEYNLETRQWIRKTITKLSDNEKDILRLIAQGLSNKEIGEILRYSEQTIKTYRKYLKNKLLTNNTCEAVIYALNNGLFLT